MLRCSHSRTDGKQPFNLPELLSGLQTCNKLHRCSSSLYSFSLSFQPFPTATYPLKDRMARTPFSGSAVEKKKKKQVFTTARLFFLLFLYFFFSNSWHLVWFLTASELMFCIIITPGFFSAAVMTASESNILCNERVFTLFYLMYITLHLSTLNFISICWPLNHLHTYSMFSCQKQKFHTPSNYSFWFSPSIRYFFMKIFAKFIHLQ